MNVTKFVEMDNLSETTIYTFRSAHLSLDLITFESEDNKKFHYLPGYAGSDGLEFESIDSWLEYLKADGLELNVTGVVYK